MTEGWGETIRSADQTLSRARLRCVSFAYQSFSWELDFEAQTKATELGIGFWFDAYSFGDHHDEMVELDRIRY